MIDLCPVHTVISNILAIISRINKYNGDDVEAMLIFKDYLTTIGMTFHDAAIGLRELSHPPQSFQQCVNTHLSFYCVNRLD